MKRLSVSSEIYEEFVSKVKPIVNKNKTVSNFKSKTDSDYGLEETSWHNAKLSI